MLRIGLTGLPECGKTTLFRALTGVVTHVGAAAKREVHVGQAKVPDARLEELNRIFQRPKNIHAMVEYVDVAGFKEGDSRRSGLEDQFLGDLRTCDALLHVLRCFDAPGLSAPDPIRDFRAAEAEFILADQIILEKRQQRLQRDLQKHATPEGKIELDLLHHCLETLNDERPLRRLNITAAERPYLRAYQPLSSKPQLVVLNVNENDVRREAECIKELGPQIEGEGIRLSAACATLEMEITQLDAESAAPFMADLGIEASALERLVRASYDLLGLISFFTVGDAEVRAWTIRRGSSAREAAGAVHTDMEHGFIRAEAVHFADFQPRGSFASCRHDGVLRLEGKDYVVQDGDIIQFRFNV
jgi:GTP-binding protein YchF